MDLRVTLAATTVVALLLAFAGCEQDAPGCGSACVPNPGGSAATR